MIDYKKSNVTSYLWLYFTSTTTEGGQGREQRAGQNKLEICCSRE